MTTTLYPKTYATVVSRDGVAGTVLARPDGGNKPISLSLGWRNGKGSTGEIGPGTRIKVYRRPGRPHPNFRLMGS